VSGITRHLGWVKGQSLKKNIKTRPVIRTMCTYNVGDHRERERERESMEQLMFIVFIWSHILRIDHQVLIMSVAFVHFLGIFKKCISRNIILILTISGLLVVPTLP
jgi:hypothetical protein